MKKQSILYSLAVIAIAVVCFAGTDDVMGTWKLNESKSKLNPTGGKNTTVIYAPAGDSIKVTVDGVDGAGKPVHNEWTGKFDGKDYPVTGDPGSDMRSYKQVDDYTLELTIKKEGKVTITGTIVVSPDGKTRTVSTSGMDSNGQKFSVVGVYEKN